MKYAVVAATILFGWPCVFVSAEPLARSSRSGMAINVHSLKSLQGSAPSSARHLIKSLHRTAKIFDGRRHIQNTLRQLRTDRDSIKTELTAFTSELEVIEQHRGELQSQLAATEVRQVKDLQSLRVRLEGQVKHELLRTGQQIIKELQQDTQREIALFENRQRGTISRELDQELEIEAKELEQLSQEIDLQTQELAGRLNRLNADESVAGSVARTMRTALDKRGQLLDMRRKKAEVEREVQITARRKALKTRLMQEQNIEQHRRMTMKEASLRQDMAELLHTTRIQFAGEIGYVRRSHEEATERFSKLTARQTKSNQILEAAEINLADQTDRARSLGIEWDNTVDELEIALQRLDPNANPEAFKWFQDTILYLTPDLNAELAPLPQRVLARAAKERELVEQQRALRERQLSLQLAKEMEGQRRIARKREKKIRERKAQKADDLLQRVKRLAARGDHQEALILLTEAQALQPPQLNRIMIVREEVLTARAQQARAAKSAELERLFTTAMKAFETGDYEKSIVLFEQVVNAEAAVEEPRRMMAETTR